MLTDDAPVSANDTLAALIAEAEAATEKMAADNPNRGLLLRLCAYGLAVTQRCAALEAEIAAHETPRVTLAY